MGSLAPVRINILLNYYFRQSKTLWQKHKGRCCHRHPLLLSLFRCSLYRSIHKDCFSVKYYFIFQLNIYAIYNFSSSLCHRRTQASLGIRRSPLGDTATDPTFGPSGRQERLNCCAKNLQVNVLNHLYITAGL